MCTKIRPVTVCLGLPYFHLALFYKNISNIEYLHHFWYDFSKIFPTIFPGNIFPIKLSVVLYCPIELVTISENHLCFLYVGYSSGTVPAVSSGRFCAPCTAIWQIALKYSAFTVDRLLEYGVHLSLFLL